MSKFASQKCLTTQNVRLFLCEKLRKVSEILRHFLYGLPHNVQSQVPAACMRHTKLYIYIYIYIHISDGSVVSFKKTAVAVLASVVVFLKTAVTVLMRLY